MVKDFTGRVAFITGGASGAGFGQAQVFGRAGSRVAIADVRQTALDDAVAALTAEGIDAWGVQLDVTDRAAYAAAADAVEAHFGDPVTLLFNTAGVNGFGPVAEASYSDFDWVLGVNLGGVINGMQTFVPRMLASGRTGHIVTVASMAGFTGSPSAAIYSAAKAAVINLMESYSLELPGRGIGVSLLCPASIRSGIAEALQTRPEALGEGSSFSADPAFIDLQRQLYSGGMEPIELAEHVKRAVEEDLFWVLPFTETKEGLRAHFDGIIAAYDTFDTDPESAASRAANFVSYQQASRKLARDQDAIAPGQVVPG